jgi:sugar lactone lactonase YvrE
VSPPGGPKGERTPERDSAKGYPAVDARFAVASPHVAVLAESPVWCAQRRTLYWIDVRGPTLFALDGSRWTLPEIVGGVALADDGRLVLAMKSGLFLFDTRSAALTRHAVCEPPDLDNRMNECKCDRRGRLWAGTMRDFGAATTGSLYRVVHGQVQRMLCDVTIPNGQCFSPDGGTLYFADTVEGRIRAYDVGDGVPRNPRVVLDAGVLPGRPDGATVDADGFVWSARYGGGGVARVHPSGRVDRFLRLPVSQVSSVMFGGDDLRTLYVTTSRQRLSAEALAREPLAGSLLAVDVGVRGLPEPRYAL